MGGDSWVELLGNTGNGAWLISAGVLGPWAGRGSRRETGRGSVVDNPRGLLNLTRIPIMAEHLATTSETLATLPDAAKTSGQAVEDAGQTLKDQSMA
jgi:hypothetical protein